MIPCQVCGKDASTHWVAGLPPAPDSQKTGLCAEHDTPENRTKALRAWQEMLAADIATVESLARYKAAPEERLITVRFTGGGTLSFTGTSCRPTDQNTLCIEEVDGARTFIPLQQVREYTITPVPAGAEQKQRSE